MKRFAGFVLAVIVAVALCAPALAAPGKGLPHGKVVMKGGKTSGAVAVAEAPVMPTNKVEHNAPMAIETTSVPVIMPFRVWVLPVFSGGVQTSGSYEYFQLQMGQESQTVLSAPGLEPVVAPIMPQQGEPTTPPR